jgi:predicted MFS family arabinose efflux permease
LDTAPDIRSTPLTGSVQPSSSISFGMKLVMAIACGMTVANIYYNQPMLGLMENAFLGRSSLIGFVPTVTQLGYAAGLLLLVPLGDRIERRRLILIQILALAISLAGTALAPNAWSLLLASALVGVTSSVAQQILPFAAELAAPDRRGATIGTVMSGLLCGILFSRVLAGSVGEHYGWRAMFWLGLFLAVALGALLAFVLPRRHPKMQANYAALLRSLVTIWWEEPKLRQATMIQACVFGSFSALWTTLALHLDSRYHFDAQIAGLFGFVGAAGVMFAPIAGKIGDRKGPRFVIGFATIVMVVSWALLGLWNMIAGMVVGVIVLDFGAQSAQVSNQHVIHGLRPEARNRLNAILMGGMFIGGAAGSAWSSLAWRFAGWPAVCALGAVSAILASCIHVRRIGPKTARNAAAADDREGTW